MNNDQMHVIDKYVMVTDLFGVNHKYRSACPSGPSACLRVYTSATMPLLRKLTMKLLCKVR